VELARGVFVTHNVRLEEPLARGGMGVVWVAEHLGLETRVAVKFIATEAVDVDPGRVHRFRREASIAARLSSPHVVRVFDHGRMQDGTPYIVMELLRGETLGALLERERKLPVRKVVAIVAQVAGVLESAHAAGIVHRDVKPENIFLLDVEYDLFVKLLDFGVAKHGPSDAVASVAGPVTTGDVTRTGAVLGTPWTMAPEQLVDAHEVDHRADLWALAVVAYRALTGERPFAGRSAAEVGLSMHGTPLVPATERAAELPSAFDAWFTRAFSLTREHRFPSARALARALQEAAASAGEEVLAPRARVEAPEVDGSTDGGQDTSGFEKVESTLEGAVSRVEDGTPRGRRRRPLVVSAGLVAAIGVGAAALLIRSPEEATAVAVEASAAVAAEVATPITPPATSEAAAPLPTEPTAPASAAVRAPKPSLATAPKAGTAPARSKAPQAAPPVRPAYCGTDDAYLVDDHGHLRPKPECL
jgi:eukaryotic-like serine/threonine-protein kinase